MILRTKTLEMEIDPETGAIAYLMETSTGRHWAQANGGVPFLLETGQNEFSSAFSSFAASEQENGLRLRWQLEGGGQVEAEICAGEEEFTFRAEVTPAAGKTVHSLEYPLLGGIKPPQGVADTVAHAYATGFMVDEPYRQFTKEGEGFRYMPYPESFSGCSMQFFTYYLADGGGLYFAARDGAFHQKWLNFYHADGALRASQVFGYEDIGPGKPLKADWDFVVRTFTGDWYDACELYKEWALRQLWCQKGPRAARPANERPDWLFEKTGAVTFGINGMHDRTKWIKRYHQDVGQPVFHVTGPDWSREPQTYGSGIPGGYDDWFPTCFSAENIETAHALGDHFAPFEFDFLIAHDKADSDKIAEARQLWPEKPKSCDAYTFNMLCPVCGYTKDLHVRRDLRVSQESGCDAMYYDISANNILYTCMSEEHGHPVGGGAVMAQAYRDIYAGTCKALSEDRGKYIPLGTEMINEIFLDVLDYYQARANAQPCSSLETWPYRRLIRAGKARTIPMFQYVYGGYAPLRMDGWGKLTAEGGDQVYHTIAKTYLWGGLFEINSEYSPMEVLDADGENPANEHYCHYAARGYAYDEEAARYIAKFAALRCGAFGKWLAYGEMQKPPRLECRSIYRSYLQYNHGEKAGEQNDRGIIALPAVMAQGYRLDGEDVLFVANTTAFAEACSLQLPAAWQGKALEAVRSYTPGQEAPQPFDAKELADLRLQPYQLMVIRPQG